MSQIMRWSQQPTNEIENMMQWQIAIFPLLTHFPCISMWTTAGAAFSTTSAMKLNLCRGVDLPVASWDSTHGWAADSLGKWISRRLLHTHDPNSATDAEPAAIKATDLWEYFKDCPVEYHRGAESVENGVPHDLQTVEDIFFNRLLEPANLPDAAIVLASEMHYYSSQLVNMNWAEKDEKGKNAV